MTTPEASPEDVQEQSQTPSRDAAPSVEPVLGTEVPEADAVEQAAAASPADHVATRDLPLEADPADAAEQASVVDLDEDERR